jgi:hypothetical protein
VFYLSDSIVASSSLVPTSSTLVTSTTIQPSSSASVVASATFTSAASIASAAVPSNKVSGYRGFEYVGCVQDVSDRALISWNTDSKLTNEKCIDLCISKGFQYAGSSKESFLPRSVCSILSLVIES